MTKMLVSMTLALGALASPASETTVTLAVRNWYCAACPHAIKQSLAAVPGVIDVAVSDKTKTASVTFDDKKTDVKSLTQTTAEAGYPSLPLYGRGAVGCCGHEGPRAHYLRRGGGAPAAYSSTRERSS